MPPREDAISALPRALQSPAVEQWGRRTWTWDVDETQVTLLDVESAPTGVVLHRQVWCYDEDDHAWSLDECGEWELPMRDAVFVADAVRAGTTGNTPLIPLSR